MTDIQDQKLTDSVKYVNLVSQTHPHLNYRVDEHLGHLFVAHLDIAEPLLPGSLRRAIEASQKIVPRYLKPKALFLGTPFEPYRQDEVLNALPPLDTLSGVLKTAQESHDTQCVVMTNISPTHPRIPELLHNRFTLLPSFPDMVMNLREVSSFDDYLLTLKSEDRSSIRRNLRVFGERGYTLNLAEDGSLYEDALFQAYLPFFERAKVKWFPHTQAFFRDATKLGTSVRLFIAFDSDHKLAGFSMGFFHSGMYHAGRLGVRADLHLRDRVYFALLYRFIEDAIALRAHTLSLEPTAYRLKRHLGAKPKPVVNAILGQSLFWKSALWAAKPVGYFLLQHLNRLRLLEANY